jgi:RNA-directed DNA polymerase
MKSYGGLFNTIISMTNLKRAMHRAALGKHNRGTVQRFLLNGEEELKALQRDIGEGDYVPGDYDQFMIMDPKPRLISCADFRDRIVHHAVCAVIAPLIERRLIADNFACRKGKGSHRALLRAREFTYQYANFLKTDIRHYYDTIDHQILLEKLQTLFREKKVIHLLQGIIQHPVPGQMSGKGLPIGNLTSQWFANLYLDEVDHWLKEEWKVKGYIRYMDDLACWDDSRERLNALTVDLSFCLTERLHIEMKSERTFVSPCSEGIPFLGWRVYPNLLRRQGNRLRRQRRLLKRREKQYQQGEISAEKLQDCIRALNGPRKFLGFGEPIRSALDI